MAIDLEHYPELETFIEDMHSRHGLSESDLRYWFGQVQIRDDIIDAMKRPREALPWHEYRKQFVTKNHARLGQRFWRTNKAALDRAQAQYGVPPEIILAIIGIETQYGRNKGGYPVLDALTTLAFAYPPRSKFFRGELEQYLLLTEELKLDPLAIKGSYAGAVGLPQFIPSSYRHYAVDFDNDNKRDLLSSAADSIGSVGNYFKSHGWQAGEPIVDDTQLEGSHHIWFANLGIKPKLALKHFISYGIFPTSANNPELRAALFELEKESGPFYLFGYNNFYVITRYNHSKNYAMAVVELSELIKDLRMAGQK